MPTVETYGRHVVAIDGESKVCKSSVTDDIATHLSLQNFSVITGDAGRFFRTLDHDAQAEMGVDGAIGPPYDALDAAIGRVIANGTAFDPGIERGDLERPAIADTVSIVAKRPGVQQAGIQWYESTFKKVVSSGTDVFIVNGRNPVDRLNDVLYKYSQAVTLSLLVYCDPEVAARRVLATDGYTDPGSEQVAEQQAKIEMRRLHDRSRPVADFPYADPGRTVWFNPDACPYGTLELARYDNPHRPYPIYFDTTEMGREDMRHYARSLADAALQLTVRT